MGQARHPQHCPLGPGQGASRIPVLDQLGVERLHESGGGPVIDRPQGRHHLAGAGVEKGLGESDPVVARRDISEGPEPSPVWQADNTTRSARSPRPNTS